MLGVLDFSLPMEFSPSCRVIMLLVNREDSGKFYLSLASCGRLAGIC